MNINSDLYYAALMIVYQRTENIEILGYVKITQSNWFEIQTNLYF